MKALRIFQIVVTLFVGVGAVAGALMMWADPSGRSFGMDTMLDLLRAKMPWPDVFFKDYMPSGFILLAVNGITQLAAAILLLKKHRLAPYAVLACGIILLLWIVLEWWVWGFNAMSNAFFVIGLIEVAAGMMSIPGSRSIS